MRKIKLNDQTEIDLIGSGTNTFGKENHEYSAPININMVPIGRTIRWQNCTAL